MRRFHIALGVSDIEDSVDEYTKRLGAAPTLVVPGEYALFRTDTLNLSLRRTTEGTGSLRHLGWEDSEATAFTMETDRNGIVWEHFSTVEQDREIQSTWPGAGG